MTFIKGPAQAIEYLAKTIETLEKKLDDTYPTPMLLLKYEYDEFLDLYRMDIEKLNNFGKSPYPYSYNVANISSEEEINKRATSLNALLDKFEESLKDTRDKNLAIIEHNKTVISKITMIMTQIGIPASYQEPDTKSRARTPKYITKRAGYLEDISRKIITFDASYNSIKARIDRQKAAVSKWQNEAIHQFNVNRSQIEKENKEKEQEQIKAYLRVKFNLAYDADYSDLEQAVITKSHYLYLAHYLHKNRLDWTDGFDYADTGLDYFQQHMDNASEEDKEILKCIQQCIDNWEGDGRTFRDCEWSYDDLYGLVPPEVMADYGKLRMLYV